MTSGAEDTVRELDGSVAQVHNQAVLLGLDPKPLSTDVGLVHTRSVRGGRPDLQATKPVLEHGDAIVKIISIDREFHCNSEASAGCHLRSEISVTRSLHLRHIDSLSWRSSGHSDVVTGRIFYSVSASDLLLVNAQFSGEHFEDHGAGAMLSPRPLREHGESVLDDGRVRVLHLTLRDN